MLYVDVPTPPEFKALNAVRADACVSIYLTTTPLSQQSDASRIELRNSAKEAQRQLEAAEFDKRRSAALMENLDDLADDDDFWRLQANSLAILATADSIRTFRLANTVAPTVQVADRFHLKPLLRAITFPHSALVLALSENAVRLVEVFADLPPMTVKVDGLPKDAASAVRKSTLRDRAPSRRIQGSEGRNVRLRQYARQVDAALRVILAGRDTPLILASTGRLSSIYRSVNSYPNLLADGIEDSPDRIGDADLAKMARPVLDASYRKLIAELTNLYEMRAQQSRVTSDLSDAARAATFGAIEALLVDIDTVVAGTLDEDTGVIAFADDSSAASYGVVDEIAGRALVSGARVLGVRKADLPCEGELAAILRYAM